jgi:hypothetical protein
MPSIRIVAAGTHLHEVTGELPSLKTLAREAAGLPLRRIGRFVELALIGAGRCLKGRTLPAGCATYFTSARGDLGVTLDVLAPLCENSRSPAPFAFINTVGNSACFHVAKCFGVSGRNQFVTSRYAPLESALRLAMLDLTEGRVTMALVGSADICTAPLAAHRERIGVAPGTLVGEATHWFLLDAGADAGASLGALRSVLSFPDESSLCAYLERHPIDPGSAVLATGQHLGADRRDMLRAATGIDAAFDYRSDLPWYDSQTGSGVHRFLEAPSARTLVHVDGDPTGRRTLLVVDTLGTGTGTCPR